MFADLKGKPHGRPPAVNSQEVFARSSASPWPNRRSSAPPASKPASLPPASMSPKVSTTSSASPTVSSVFPRYQAQAERLYRRAAGEFEKLKVLRPELPDKSPVAVGITVARYPPHRSVRAAFPIRLLPWMNSVKAYTRIRMRDADAGNPSAHQSVHALPSTRPFWLRRHNVCRQYRVTASRASVVCQKSCNVVRG